MTLTHWQRTQACHHYPVRAPVHAAASDTLAASESDPPPHRFAETDPRCKASHRSSVPAHRKTGYARHARTSQPMSNCEVNNLPVLELEPHQLREVLRCVLHTIVFNRALGAFRPKEVDSELFDITYAQCGDANVEKTVEEKIDQFYTWVEKHPRKKGQVVLAFFEKRKTQRWSLIGGKQEERLYWEQWCINISIVEPSIGQQSSFTLSDVRERRHAKLQAAMEEVMTAIVRLVNDKKDHIPPVTSPAVLTFPFEITIAGDGSVGYGLETVKRLLMHTSPPPVLS